MQKNNSAAKTHVGKVRQHNEDDLCVNAELGLYVIADGMGGHASGEVASNIAVTSIEQLIAQGASLQEAVEQAHFDIIDGVQAGLGKEGMGTTVVALQLKGDDYTLAWVGDSRAYLWDGELTQITKDHSFVQMLIDSGQITEKEARTHPRKNIIYQNLGSRESSHFQVSVQAGQLFKNQQLLLCSDGLTDEIDDQEISKILAAAGSEGEIVEQMIEAALASGGHDNVSVIVVSARDDAILKPDSIVQKTIDRDTLIPQE